MLATVHLFFGAAIGKIFSSLWVIIPLAIASHYLLDLIPHYSLSAPKNWKEKNLSKENLKEFSIKSIEPILGISLLVILILTSQENKLTILIGAFFGFFPDILCYIAWKHNLIWAEKILPTTKSHFYTKLQNKKGFVMQALFFTIGLILFLIF